MPPSDEPIVRFHQLSRRGRAPMRADRSALGTLPMRAVRYCEAVTSATGFGWYVFPAMDIKILWDGSDIFWCCDEAPDWMPLLPSAQMPDYAAEFDAVAPESLKGCSPPFLTALPEPGALQMWTGLIAETAPGWHLLARAPANMAGPGGVSLFEGLIETDRWFGPLFANMRFTRSHTPIRLRSDYPILQVQPVQRMTYSAETLDRMSVSPGPEHLTEAQWAAYHATIAEPNSRPDRAFGAYATAARKKRHECARAGQAAPADVSADAEV